MLHTTKKLKSGSIRNIQSNEQVINIKVSKIVRKLYTNIKFELKNGRGRLCLGKGRKWIDMGSYKTRTYKILKYILESSNKSKKVIDVFEYIKIKQDDKNEDLRNEYPRSYGMKKEIIKRAIDELQRSKYLKGRIGNLSFNDKKNTVTIKLK